jgi:hypothetical protein
MANRKKDEDYDELTRFLGDIMCFRLEYADDRKREVLRRWEQVSPGEWSMGELVEVLAAAIGRLNMVQMELLRDMKAIGHAPDA